MRGITFNCNIFSKIKVHPSGGVITKNGVIRCKNDCPQIYMQITVQICVTSLCKWIFFIVLDFLGSKEHHMIRFECRAPFNPKKRGGQRSQTPQKWVKILTCLIVNVSHHMMEHFFGSMRGIT